MHYKMDCSMLTDEHDDVIAIPTGKLMYKFCSNNVRNEQCERSNTVHFERLKTDFLTPLFFVQ